MLTLIYNFISGTGKINNSNKEEKTFFNLPSGEQKKIINKATRQANKEQLKLVNKSKREYRTVR